MSARQYHLGGSSVLIVTSIGVAIAGVAAMLFLWADAAETLSDLVLPGPWSVAERMLSMLITLEVWLNVFASVARVVFALFASLLIGGGLALASDRLPLLRDAIDRRIHPVMNAFPSLGWAMLGVLWFGVSEFTVVFVETMILVPFCFVNIAAGLACLDREIEEMAQSFTRKWYRRLVLVTIPLMTPYVIAAVRMALGVAWKIALVAELFGAQDGLGYALIRAQSAADATTVLAICFIIVFVYVAGERFVIDPLSRKFPVY